MHQNRNASADHAEREQHSSKVALGVRIAAPLWERRRGSPNTQILTLQNKSTQLGHVKRQTLAYESIAARKHGPMRTWAQRRLAVDSVADVCAHVGEGICQTRRTQLQRRTYTYLDFRRPTNNTTES